MLQAGLCSCVGLPLSLFVSHHLHGFGKPHSSRTGYCVGSLPASALVRPARQLRNRVLCMQELSIRIVSASPTSPEPGTVQSGSQHLHGLGQADISGTGYCARLISASALIKPAPQLRSRVLCRQDLSICIDSAGMSCAETPSQLWLEANGGQVLTRDAVRSEPKP